MTSTAAVDLFSQVLKSLSERCPFDGEEVASRVTTLPARVAGHLSDGRRKFKKSAAGEHGEQGVDVGPQVSKQSKVPNLWDIMEVYFRPITVVDIESLRPKNLDESCFFIPVAGSSFEVEEKCVSFSGSGVGVSLDTVKEMNEEGEDEEEAKSARDEGQPVEIDSDETTTLPILKVEEKVDDDDGSAMNWVVGSKHRAVLTTQRPTKKRKLLGTDAGLDQLLALPHSEPSPVLCDVCCLSMSEGKSNKIVTCSSCGVLVHQKCYGLQGTVTAGTWICSWCKHLEGMPNEKRGELTGLRSCLLCPKDGGALKPVGGYRENENYAHLFCSLWTPEVYVDNIGAMEPVLNVEGIPEMRARLVCNVCKVKHGACVRCSYGKFLQCVYGFLII